MNTNNNGENRIARRFNWINLPQEEEQRGSVVVNNNINLPTNNPSPATQEVVRSNGRTTMKKMARYTYLAVLAAILLGAGFALVGGYNTSTSRFFEDPAQKDYIFLDPKDNAKNVETLKKQIEKMNDELSKKTAAINELLKDLEKAKENKILGYDDINGVVTKVKYVGGAASLAAAATYIYKNGMLEQGLNFAYNIYQQVPTQIVFDTVKFAHAYWTQPTDKYA